MVRYFGIVAVVGCVVVGPVRAQDASPPTKLTISESGNNYVVTLPVSQLVLTIPKGGFVAKPLPGGPTSENYFSFRDDSRVVYLSGWFSPEAGFPGIKEAWAADVAKWKKRPELPEPRNVSFEQQGSWNVVLYDMQAQGITIANLRAHWVEAGTWLDVHISRTSDRAAGLQADLKSLLKTLTVSKKGTLRR